jgi:hypothetical protein
MSVLLIFILISIGFWIYTTKVNPNFLPEAQDNFVKYIKDFIKKATPSSDSMFDNNVTLMKMNLYLLSFNKNLDMYNRLYTSNKLSFLGINDNIVNLEFTDISNLLPPSIPLSADILKSKLEVSFKNNLGFSRFFINLCAKGVYLIDYSNLFIDLLKPILIIKSLDLTQQQKVEKLNILNPNFNHTADNLNTININNIIDIIYNIILILSNITIEYKNIIDLNDKINIITNTEYVSQKNIINTKMNVYKTQFNTYLNNTGFEYLYMKNYISNIFDIEQFTLNQEISIYINIYKMLKNIDMFAAYDSNITSVVLPYLNNLNL